MLTPRALRRRRCTEHGGQTDTMSVAAPRTLAALWCSKPRRGASPHERVTPPPPIPLPRKSFHMRANSSEAFTPPKPNEFESAASMPCTLSACPLTMHVPAREEVGGRKSGREKRRSDGAKKSGEGCRGGGERASRSGRRGHTEGPWRRQNYVFRIKVCTCV